MKIEIKVTTAEDEMNQAQSQTVKRVATVLRGHGFDVEIIYDLVAETA